MDDARTHRLLLLLAHHGRTNLSALARELGVDRGTVYRRLVLRETLRNEHALALIALMGLSQSDLEREVSRITGAQLAEAIKTFQLDLSLSDLELAIGAEAARGVLLSDLITTEDGRVRLARRQQ